MEISEKGRKSPKRILIDVPEEVHKAVKEKAAGRNVTLRRWVLQAIKMRLDREEI
jgi:predicted HicB family RNase H-like nuclease